VGVAFDDEVAAMRRAVMGSTNSHEIGELVAAAFGAQLHVMQVDKRRVSATGHSAAVLITEQRGPA